MKEKEEPLFTRRQVLGSLGGIMVIALGPVAREIQNLVKSLKIKKLEDKELLDIAKFITNLTTLSQRIEKIKSKYNLPFPLGGIDMAQKYFIGNHMRLCFNPVWKFLDDVTMDVPSTTEECLKIIKEKELFSDLFFILNCRQFNESFEILTNTYFSVSQRQKEMKGKKINNSDIVPV